MKRHKRVIDRSTVLGRMAHADVFELGTEPKFLLALFGGSGVDEELYEERARSVIPVFDGLLASLAQGPLSLIFVHVTAPYDLPFNDFAGNTAAAATWNAHVAAELLEPWSGLPYFVSGFSGGAVLALNGLQNDQRCFGGGALGWDSIPPDFVCPGHWSGKLMLYAAPDDRVCNHPNNRRVAERLVSRGQADLFHLPAGGHSLKDYSNTEGLGDLIRHASKLAPQ